MSGLFQDDPAEQDEAPPPPEGRACSATHLPVALPEPVHAAAVPRAGAKIPPDDIR